MGDKIESYLMAAVVIKFRLPASGIHSPQDLLLPFRSWPFPQQSFWSYYLYPQGCNFHKGIDGLCGEVIRHTGSCVSEQSCHIFPDRPVAGCISFIGATTNTVWNAVV